MRSRSPRPLDRLRRFLAAEDASLSVEAVIIVPILFWAYAAMFVYWDAYKTENLTTKASYTIGDVLSRSDEVDKAYLDRMNDLFGYLTQARGGTRIRISLVQTKLQEDGETLETRLAWSHPTSGADRLTSMAPLEGRLPETVAGDEMIVVETFRPFDPLFAVGLRSRTIENFVFTRPRTAQLICVDCEPV